MSSPEPRDRYEADPVPLGPKGWGAARTFTVVTAAAVALIVAIAKPWAGGASGTASVADASPSASASAVSSRSSLTSPDVGAQATPSPPASRPEGGATGILTGTWGIATLGPTSPGSEAAAIWSPVAPRSVDASSRPPQCSLADLHASGSVVAITVPPALRSAWSVRVVTGGPDGRPFSIATRRVPLPQATASSVAYLARADGKSWGSGALRFVVRWPGGSVALDTCFVGVPLAGSLPSIADALEVDPVSESGPAPSDGRLWNGWEPGYP